ncbi:NAD(P)-dependent alcohol dehydrogenase [Pengzhenrongella sp.]|jgi:NADPH:quinone reductase-like Zn-dependent oxidoreductase|uniref:NAD(P)-dependent alcohol dehydrogenase n=1 Tax=Pengzhenrongella sp. TaxID=2888820 RepID=UPI002F94FAF6
MKAAVSTRYGPPDVVRIEEVAMPTVADHEVLVKVHVATANRTDCGFRSGTPFIVRFFSGLRRPRVTVLGSEFAGVVEAVGGRVTTFEVGTRVFGYNENRWGAHAQYLTIPEDGPIATMPPNVTFEQAAPSTEASHYALAAIRKTKIGPGHEVLVYGATGGIGTAAVQLLKTIGANVTAVCDTPQVDLVKGLGADRVIDRSIEDFTKDPQTYDVVLDAVGKSSFGRCRPLLKPRGIYASTDLGRWAQNPLLSVLTPFFGGKRATIPLPQRYDRELVQHFGDLLGSGDFRPVIDRRYDLAQIVDAYTYVETGQKIGNVLIVVDPAI